MPDSGRSTGNKACPYTTLYWAFLDKHEENFKDHPRMRMMMNNLYRFPDEKIDEIRKQATQIRKKFTLNRFSQADES